jgi:hypothetical protein
MKSLLEIEEAIAKLPAKARCQLVQDIPALCPGEFPEDGWDAILNDPAPRPRLSSLLDKLDTEIKQLGSARCHLGIASLQRRRLFKKPIEEIFQTNED